MYSNLPSYGRLLVKKEWNEAEEWLSQWGQVSHFNKAGLTAPLLRKGHGRKDFEVCPLKVSTAFDILWIAKRLAVRHLSTMQGLKRPTSLLKCET